MKAKDILLYGEIYSYSARSFIEQIDEQLELTPDADITVRVNTEGGEPEYGWGMAAKFAELKNKKVVKNDGMAHSMGLYFNCYADDSECLDVTEFCLHRCAYPSWFENNPILFTEERRSALERINKSLRAAFEGKVDVTKFENLKQVKEKGIKLKDVFSMDSRIDVYLTAKDAKAIGLVNRIVPITPSKTAEIASLMGAAYSVKKAASTSEIEEEKKSKTNKNKVMDKATLKAEHSSLYNEIFEEGVKSGKATGTAEEKDRIEALLVYREHDPKAIDEAISKGEKLSQKQVAELSLKAITAAAKLKDVKEDNADDVKTDEPKEASKEEKEKSDWAAGVRKESQVLSEKK